MNRTIKRMDKKAHTMAIAEKRAKTRMAWDSNTIDKAFDPSVVKNKYMPHDGGGQKEHATVRFGGRLITKAAQAFFHRYRSR